MKLALHFLFMVAILLAGMAPSAFAGTESLEYETQQLTLHGVSHSVRVPKGYQHEYLADMDAPRMLTFAANGDLFAGSRSGRARCISAVTARRRDCSGCGRCVDRTDSAASGGLSGFECALIPERC